MDNIQFNRRISIAKLIISATVPLMIGVCGYFVQRSVVEFESHRFVAQEISVKLADRRLLIYDKIKEPLNQIYCYVEEICEWQTLSVEEVKKTRQSINRIMYADRAIWSPDTFQLYVRYIDRVAFQLQNNGMDAKIRAEINLPRTHSPDWSDDSPRLFTGEKSAEHRNTYRLLNNALAGDLMLLDYKNVVP